MSVSNKTRAVLNIANRKPAELAECLGIPVQSVRNKFSRDVFSVSDLLKIFDFLGCKMYVEFEDGQRVQDTIDDVKDSDKTSHKSKEKPVEEKDLTDMDKLIINAVLNPSVPPEGTKVITAEDILKRNE